jgi:hypothetical protein
MRKQILTAVGLVLLIAGCGSSGDEKPGVGLAASGNLSREEQVQVLVLERMLKNFGNVAPGDEEPQANYLATCNSLHLFGADGKPQDPSDKVMAAVKEPAFPIKRYSECVVKTHERIAVSDRTTGQPGRILWVGRPEWKDDQTVEVSGGVWENLKFGPGEILRIQWKDGRWIITPIGAWDT